MAAHTHSTYIVIYALTVHILISHTPNTEASHRQDRATVTRYAMTRAYLNQQARGWLRLRLKVKDVGYQ